MSHTINRYYRYNLFWIYPLIFIGLTVYAVIADRHEKNRVEYRGQTTKSIVPVRLSSRAGIVDTIDLKDRFVTKDLHPQP
jgi:hypothetical protein